MKTPEEFRELLGGQILLFDTKISIALCGITTNLFGSTGYGDKRNPEDVKLEQMQSKKLQGNFVAHNYYKIDAQHGDEIIVINEKNRNQNYFPCDALISFRDGYKPLLISNTADCPIITLTDTMQSFLAIVHSGWSGTNLNIINKTIEKALKNGRTNSDIIHATVWPGICEQCYTVNEDVAGKFPDYSSYNGKNYNLSLRKTIVGQLHQAGISDDRILCPDVCSNSRHFHRNNYHFYSYRHDKNNFRNAVFCTLSFP